MAARRAGGRKSLFLKRLFLSYVLLLVPAFFVFTACTSHLFMRQQQMVAAAAQTELDRIAMQLAAELRDMETQSLYLSLFHRRKVKRWNKQISVMWPYLTKRMTKEVHCWQGTIRLLHLGRQIGRGLPRR